jgi:hypothetical protein
MIRRWRSTRRSATVLVALGALALGAPDGTRPAPSGATATPVAPEGFGAATRAGDGQGRHHVTSLADAGPGTLRDALSAGHRWIVFDAPGTIALESRLRVRGAFITIDASGAPPPGITVRHHGLHIDGRDGAHDVVVRGLRIRGSATRDTNVNTSNDCISVSHGAYNVLIERVSVSGCSDGAIDIIGDPAGQSAPTRDITVQWSLLADTRKTMLIKYGTTRISLHHNLLVRGLVRLPYVTREPLAIDPGLTVDMRNNVVWDWAGGFGTAVVAGATANIVNNVYGNPGGGVRDRGQALIVCRGVSLVAGNGICPAGARAEPADAYVAGNVSLDGVALDRAGTVAVPFAAAPVSTSDACTAARQVLATAGAPPRDPVDAGYVAPVALEGCA